MVGRTSYVGSVGVNDPKKAVASLPVVPGSALRTSTMPSAVTDRKYCTAEAPVTDPAVVQILHQLVIRTPRPRSALPLTVSTFESPTSRARVPTVVELKIRPLC